MLRQQLKGASQINEERLLELIKIGKAALSQDGREVERKVLERFVNLREEQKMKQYMVRQGNKNGLAAGSWQWFPKGERKTLGKISQLKPGEFEALSLEERKKLEDEDVAELEKLENDWRTRI